MLQEFFPLQILCAATLGSSVIKQTSPLSDELTLPQDPLSKLIDSQDPHLIPADCPFGTATTGTGKKVREIGISNVTKQLQIRESKVHTDHMCKKVPFALVCPGKPLQTCLLITESRIPSFPCTIESTCQQQTSFDCNDYLKMDDKTHTLTVQYNDHTLGYHVLSKRLFQLECGNHLGKITSFSFFRISSI